MEELTQSIQESRPVILSFDDLCKKMYRLEEEKANLGLWNLAEYFVKYKKGYPLVQVWFFIEEFNAISLKLNVGVTINQ
jgi:hypothetical protein